MRVPTASRVIPGLKARRPEREQSALDRQPEQLNGPVAAEPALTGTGADHDPNFRWRRCLKGLD